MIATGVISETERAVIVSIDDYIPADVTAKLESFVGRIVCPPFSNSVLNVEYTIFLYRFPTVRLRFRSRIARLELRVIANGLDDVLGSVIDSGQESIGQPEPFCSEFE
jgi:hypothetical protein